jgi:hypothetical protein
MMKKNIVLLACVWISLQGCNTTAEPKQAEKKVIKSEAVTGADADDKGCKGSAGYTYSQIKKDCIRTWEVGVMLNPISDKQKDMNIISAVFADDKTKAELFILDVKGTEILDAVPGSINSFENAIYKLNQVSGKWQLVKNGVLINKE